MGLDFRKRSGTLANGSRLIVPGQITTGQKVFPNTFSQKSAPPNFKLESLPIVTPIIPIPTNTPTPTPSVTTTPTNTPTPSVTPTPTNTPTPSVTPTFTPTPTHTPEQLINPIITENEEYIVVGNEEYLMF